VIISGNTVTIKNADNPDGFQLDQEYVKYSLPSSETVVLKDGQYFVMGDNRAESYDSRSWGILPKSDILGTPILELFPFNKIGIMPGDFSKSKK
jgi:signal peptidase I